jgi:hypothetical protein
MLLDTDNIKQMPSFESWVSKKCGSFDAFMRLRPNDKEKIYLKYRWGHESPEMNDVAERTRREIIAPLLATYEPERDKNKDRAEFFKGLVEWENYCDGIKLKIRI